MNKLKGYERRKRAIDQAMAEEIADVRAIYKKAQSQTTRRARTFSRPAAM